MRRSPAASALFALLALGLLAAAPPAAACSYVIDPNATSGPFPSPLGGAWFVLPRFDDGSLEAVHFAADGNPTRTMRLGVPGYRLMAPIYGSFAADDDGGFRVTARPRDGGGSEHFLVAFDADGTPLGRVDFAGLEIFGFDAAGDAFAYERRRDWRLALYRIDAAGEIVSELFVTEDPVMPGAVTSCGDPFTVASDGEGGVFLLTYLGGDGFGAGGTQVLQRFSAAGVETAAWRLPEREHYRLQQGAPGTVLLIEGGHPAVLWAVGDGGLIGHTVLHDGEGFNRLLPDADGGWVLRHERDVRWLDAGVSLRGRMRLGPTPQGATWSELQERVEEDAGTPVARALWGHGADAEAAVAELAAAGPTAVDQIVDWLVAQPPSGSDVHASSYLELLEVLMAADPDGTGLRLVAQFDLLPPVERTRVVHLLTLTWPRPATSFVALLEDALEGGDDRLRTAAATAFGSQRGGGMAEAAVRFPASARVQRYHLAALAAPERERPEGVYPEAFLTVQLPHVAPRLDAVLADPAHPARPAAVEWLERLPAQLGPPGQHPATEAALTRWSAEWSHSEDPRVAAAARLVAAACGDAEAVAGLAGGLADGSYGSWAVAMVYRRLRDGGSALADAALADRLTAATLGGRLESAEAAALLRQLAHGASADWWAGAFRRLADPELAPAAVEALLALFVSIHDGEPGEVPASAVVPVVTSGFVESRLAAGEASAFALAAVAWHNLAGEAELRQRLEVAFRDACRRELEVTAARLEGDRTGRGEPGGCLAAMAVAGVGRQVPDAFLTAHAEHQRRRHALRGNPYRYLSALSAIAKRRGPWPGLAELLRELEAEDVDGVHASVDAAVLAAVLGADPYQVGGRPLSSLPLLDLPELQAHTLLDLVEER